jgi:hypothetical protein
VCVCMRACVACAVVECVVVCVASRHDILVRTGGVVC